MGRHGGKTSSGVPSGVLWTAFAAGIVTAGVLWPLMRDEGAGAAPKPDRSAILSAAGVKDGIKAGNKTQTVRQTEGATLLGADRPAEEEGSSDAPASNGSRGAGETNRPQSGKPASGEEKGPGEKASDGSGAEGTGTGDRGRGVVGFPKSGANSASLKVRVYMAEENKTETVPLEDYVSGVVAAEMPLSFEPAALEAQALAARTYIVRRLRLQTDDGVPLGADVTDTTAHQVYRSIAEMKRLKESDKAAWEKAAAAARRTAGLVIAYEGEPIEALFFASGNGYTENSGEVFAGERPYLQAVASPWDRHAPGGTGRAVELSLSAFYAKMGVKTSAVVRLLSGWPAIRVLERTEGKRVKRLGIGDKERTGEEVRQRLGLSSTDFAWTVKGGKIRFTARGSGHGVGMSQWGAQGMAQAGKTAAEIVAYYYSGTTLLEASKLPDRGAGND